MSHVIPYSIDEEQILFIDEALKLIFKVKSGVKKIPRWLEVIKKNQLNSFKIFLGFIKRLMLSPIYKVLIILQLDKLLKKWNDVLENDTKIYLKVSQKAWEEYINSACDFFEQMIYYFDSFGSYRLSLEYTIINRLILMKETYRKLLTKEIEMASEKGGYTMAKNDEVSYREYYPFLSFMAIYILIIIGIGIFMVMGRMPLVSGLLGIVLGCACLFSTFNTFASRRKQNGR